jgi:hypothetical protein
VTVTTFIHRNAVTLVFLLVVALFAGTSWKLQDDNTRINRLVVAGQRSEAEHEYVNCLERNATKATVTALVGIILQSDTIPPERRAQYETLVQQLAPERCDEPVPSKE